MRRAIALASLLAFGIGAAVAQADVISQRKDQLNAMQDFYAPFVRMLRGEIAFDLARTQAGLRIIQANAKTLPALFPETSKTGNTKALPAIWENKTKFDALFVRLDAEASAAQATIKDEASFKAEVGKVLGTCTACHREFRGR